MKYTCELEIALSREKVIELFDNSENMKKWQKGLISFNHLVGEPGKVGAVSELKYQMGKRTIKMIERITVNNLPDAFHGTYESDGVFNIAENFFEIVDENNTRWKTNQEFRMSGFMKLIGFLFPGSFKKQTKSFMNDFKVFAESNFN